MGCWLLEEAEDAGSPRAFPDWERSSDSGEGVGEGPCLARLFRHPALAVGPLGGGGTAFSGQLSLLHRAPRGPEVRRFPLTEGRETGSDPPSAFFAEGSTRCFPELLCVETRAVLSIYRLGGNLSKPMS